MSNEINVSDIRSMVATESESQIQLLDPADLILGSNSRTSDYFETPSGKKVVAKIAQSIKGAGQLHPVTVFKTKQGLELAAGFRRVEAIKTIKGSMVKAVVRDLSGQSPAFVKAALAVVNLAENITAVSDPLNEARKINDAIAFLSAHNVDGTKGGYSDPFGVLAKATGRPEDWLRQVSSLLKIAKEFPAIGNGLEDGLDWRFAKALAGKSKTNADAAMILARAVELAGKLSSVTLTHIERGVEALVAESAKEEVAEVQAEVDELEAAVAKAESVEAKAEAVAALEQAKAELEIQTAEATAKAEKAVTGSVTVPPLSNEDKAKIIEEASDEELLVHLSLTGKVFTDAENKDFALVYHREMKRMKLFASYVLNSVDKLDKVGRQKLQEIGEEIISDASIAHEEAVEQFSSFSEELCAKHPSKSYQAELEASAEGDAEEAEAEVQEVAEVEVKTERTRKSRR